MDHHSVADFHANQIKQILSQADGTANIAWSASVLTATRAMEEGFFAKLFPKSAAAGVLSKAVLARQAESGPTNKWHIACLVESLATLRLLGRKYPELRSRYDLAKQEILTNLPKLDASEIQLLFRS